MTIKNVTILIITLLLFWSGIVIANISAGDNFIFECTICNLGEEVLDFIRIGGSQTYTITVNSAGSFSIDQGEVYKFKIDSSGNVGWIGEAAEANFDLKVVLASTSCSPDSFAYGIDSGGLRCVEDCDDTDCLGYDVGADRTCEYLTGDQSCEPCSYCDGASAVCVVKGVGTNDRCPACTTCNASGSCIAVTDGIQDMAGDNRCNGSCEACQGGECGYATSGSDPGNNCDTEGCSQGDCNASGSCQYYTSQERNCPTCYTCNGATSPSCVAIGNQTQDTEGGYTCSGVCQECNGSGSCINQNGTDRHNSCSPIGCYTGLCDAGGGACTYSTSGEGNCGVCKTCNSSGECVAYSDGTQDSSGTTCTGACAACYSGECSFAPADTDPGNDCGTIDCYTGSCDGSGGCDAYSNGGQYGCSTCSFCSDADTGCEYRANNYADAGCGVCSTCNGSGSCKAVTNGWGAGLYGCTGAGQRCISGICRTCNGLLFDDGCAGCAGQGDKVCWRNGGGDETCNSVCVDYGGCVAANWNDNSSCTVCRHFYPAAGCGQYGGGEKPLYNYEFGFDTCEYRNPAYEQSCSAHGWWRKRQCVCAY